MQKKQWSAGTSSQGVIVAARVAMSSTVKLSNAMPFPLVSIIV
jgi:hypothetical protein